MSKEPYERLKTVFWTFWLHISRHFTSALWLLVNIDAINRIYYDIVNNYDGVDHVFKRKPEMSFGEVFRY